MEESEAQRRDQLALDRIWAECWQEQFDLITLREIWCDAWVPPEASGDGA